MTVPAPSSSPKPQPRNTAVTMLCDPAYGWKELTQGSLTCRYVGREATVRGLLSALKGEALPRMLDLEPLLGSLKGHFALILDTPDWTLAVVDRSLGHRLFYAEDVHGLYLSNSATLLKKELGLDESDDLSLLEFRMAGYVTGRETLYKGLYQLQGGECLLWDKAVAEQSRRKYLHFLAHELRTGTEDDLIQEFDAVSTAVFERAAEDAAGRPILVPLSGGLDSRLVLCKIKQLGYDNLQTFSYGPPGNHEAKAAKYVADRLGVPWKFIPSTRQSAKAFFATEYRKRYWEFSSFCCSLPYMQDILLFWENRTQRHFPDDAVFINGNTGDFITGGHIPKPGNVDDVSVDEMFDKLMGKHFGFWKSLMDAVNRKRITDKIRTLIPLPGNRPFTFQDFAGLHEMWECAERQCKYVVNGQRSYDFAGFDWSLPLWDDEFFRFWASVPAEHKLGQSLYKRGLETLDYFGVFKDFPFTIWRWPGAMILAVPFARAVGLLLGRKAADRVYKSLGYWGHYRHLFAHFGRKVYRASQADMRGYVSLEAVHYLWEQGLGDPLPGMDLG